MPRTAPDLTAVLGCPECRAPLDATADGLECSRCGSEFLRRDCIIDFVASGREGAEHDEQLSLSRRLMQAPLLVAVYERLWRPAITRLVGLPHSEELRQLAAWLAPSPGDVVLDLACGPGNTTRSIAAAAPEATILGLDYSVPMLRQALARTKSPLVTYVRGDAGRLPLLPGSLDGANCDGALYLFDDPPAVVEELAKALRPGATFTGMLIRPGWSPPRFDAIAMLRRAGIRVHTEAETREVLAAAGFEDVETRSAGWVLLFRATRAGTAA